MRRSIRQPVSLTGYTGVTRKDKPYVVRDATVKQVLLRIIETDVCPPLRAYTRTKICDKGFTAGDPTDVWYVTCL